jgi:autotransporter-associated beta strand protein
MSERAIRWVRQGLIVWHLSLLCSTAVRAAPPGGSASWPKTFYDEFSGTSIDTAKWGYGTLPWSSGRYHKAEYSSYIMPEDSYVTNGLLVLRCRYASGSEFGGYPCSEGMVHSNGKMSYTYGYVEIRARCPLGQGTWPAFWTLSSGWPPEFDIAEFFGSGERMHMGLAYGSGSWNSSNFYNSNGETFENWHTYGLEWGPGYAIWYKDGNVKKAIYESYVPSSAMYLILNSGMTWDTNSATPFPNYFEVDYCRKYNSPAAVNDDTTGAGLHQFNYSGSWSYGSQSGAFFSDNHWSGVANAYYSVQVSGTRVDLYAAKNSNHGIAAVSLDGGPETLVDCYAASRADKILLWSASGLPYGVHNLKVRVTGTRNASSSGNTVVADRVDAWNVLPNLSGTMMGTSGSYGGSGNTKEKAIDGNLATYFDALVADGAWVGWDLGNQPKKITKVMFCPRSTYASRMVGGKFQGANAADFSDAVGLFTVTSIPDEGTMTSQALALTNGFRYVRYLGPAAAYGNIAEVEFYGAEASAANGTWIADSDGIWSDTLKWSGGTVGSGAGSTADFSTFNVSATRTVTLDASRRIGTLKFGDTAGSQGWILSATGGNALSLDTGSATSPAIVVNQNTATLAAPLAGFNGFTKSGAGTLALSGTNSLTGVLNVDTSSTAASDGIVRITSSAAIASLVSPISIRNNNSGSSTLQLDGSAGSVLVPQDIALNGRNTAVASIQNVAGTNTCAGDLAINVGGANYWLQSDSGLLVFSGTISSVAIGTRTFTFQGVGDMAVTGTITNGNASTVNVVKLGAGKLTLAGANAYSGTTTVNAGTLLVNGTISTGAVTVVGGVLGGGGVVKGAVTVQTGGMLSPGETIGVLTISNSLLLSGTTLMQLNKSLGTNDQVRGLNSVTYGGVLALTNLSGTLTAADTFRLFAAASYSGAFASLSPAVPAPGLAWNTNTLATDGTLRLVQTVNTTPTNIINQVSNNTLTLQWPADHIGWRLQAQTNGPDLGLGLNWVDVPGSPATNQLSFPLDPANGSVFFRMVFP